MADHQLAGVMKLNACSDSPLSPRERAGVRAPFATKPRGKGCAVFHTTSNLPGLMGLSACSDSPLSPRERVGVGAPFVTTPQWKGLRHFPRYG